MPLSPNTVAGRIADVGWAVELFTEPPRLRATRRQEKLTVLWDSVGTFVRARYFYAEVEETNPLALNSISAVLRLARLVPRDLPFDVTDDEDTILAALAGRQIVWRNSLTGAVETGIVPRGGLHLNITYGAGGRMLNFTDATGYRSVRLAAIEKVS